MDVFKINDDDDDVVVKPDLMQYFICYVDLTELQKIISKQFNETL
jgi:hypothetical protein